jgi:transcription antitermination factor NusG
MMRWYVIRSKPLKEDFLYEQLSAHEVEAFYPRLKVKTVNPRARQVRPYFPGYLFAHLDPCDQLFSSLQWMPGAVGIVAFGGEPASVSDGLIHAIAQRVDKLNLAHTEFLESLHQGDRVLIHGGAFTGYEGIFDVRLSGSDRVRVLLALLNNRQIPIELPAEYIQQTKQH